MTNESVAIQEVNIVGVYILQIYYSDKKKIVLNIKKGKATAFISRYL
jgi:hypothetical protein